MSESNEGPERSKYQPVPKEGPDRLKYLIDQRLRDLGMTTAQLAAEGGPTRQTLAKFLARPNQKTLTVPVLLSYDDYLGWERGSCASSLLGAWPVERQADSGAGLSTDAKARKLIRQASRHAEKLSAHLGAAAAEHAQLQRILGVLETITQPS
ncbi:hypothetical protein ONA92_26445 [Mycobacteroides salmoniphilum]|uniref:hypothetical protein n=1 Tax=Mycobacteroides salmoniphilum TaxID=404941 RepID=UPI0035683B3D